MKFLLILNIIFSLVFSTTIFRTGIAYKSTPFGLKSTSEIYYSIPLQPNRKNPLFKNTKLDLGIKLDTSPAFTYIAQSTCFEPIAVFDLSVNTGVIIHYDTFGYGFNDLQTNQYFTIGYLLDINPTIKMAYDGVYFLDTLSIKYYLYEFQQYYNMLEDIKQYSKDPIFINNIYLLYDIFNGNLIGLNDYYLRIKFKDVNIHRISVVAVFKIKLRKNILIINNSITGTDFKSFYMFLKTYIEIRK